MKLLKLEATGQAAKIYDVWFGPETKIHSRAPLK
ncbi:ABC transporter substrate-binding protein [Citrobacter koseri]|uniref:ABC transporter substrate-binding protein n=1 Tax=Citrobacter koseri TaxID=545 RepID=A0A3S5DPD5_CITKO|nr:ABC transporter substrate-binding protein [Citrobacter koseri]